MWFFLKHVVFIQVFQGNISPQWMLYSNLGVLIFSLIFAWSLCDFKGSILLWMKTWGVEGNKNLANNVPTLVFSLCFHKVLGWVCCRSGNLASSPRVQNSYFCLTELWMKSPKCLTKLSAEWCFY
jgi:hypothetical protein